MTDSSLSDATRVGSRVEVTSGLKANEVAEVVPRFVENIGQGCFKQGFSREESLDDVSKSRGSWRGYSEFNILRQMDIYCTFLQ